MKLYIRNLKRVQCTGTYKKVQRAMWDCEQKNKRYLLSNVAEHSFLAASGYRRLVRPTEIGVIASYLLHIGKPFVKTTIGRVDMFVGYEKKSAKLARQILEEAGVNEREAKQICWLIKHANKVLTASDIKLEAWTHKVGKEVIYDLFKIGLAELRTCSDVFSNNYYIGYVERFSSYCKRHGLGTCVYFAESEVKEYA